MVSYSTLTGLLTFTLYYLCKHPEAMRKIREEVDEVLGEGSIQLDDIPKLKYTTACLREALRLSPPATTRGVKALEDTIVAGSSGKYEIKKDEVLVMITGKCQTDPKVWGEDVSDTFASSKMRR